MRTPDAESEVGSAPTTDAEQIDPAAESAAEVDSEAEPAAPETAAAAVVVPAVTATSSSGGKPPRSTGGSGGSGGSGRPPRRPRPVRERFGREAIGIAVLVVLALVCGGLITAVVLKTQHDAAVAAQEAANYTPPPLATPTPDRHGSGRRGDRRRHRRAPPRPASRRRRSGARCWARRSQARSPPTPRAAWATPRRAASGETFVQAAAKVPSNADVVVFFGGAADSNVSPLSLAKAATDAFAAAKTQAPDAKLIVVGPADRRGRQRRRPDGDPEQPPHRGRHREGDVDRPDRPEVAPRGQRRAPRPPSALTAADEKTIATKMQARSRSAADPHVTRGLAT